MDESLSISRSELILGGQKSGKSRRAELLARQWLARSPAHRAVLVATFAGLVADKVKTAGGAAAEQQRWSAWSQEIFADLCLAAAAGPWAIWALAPWALTAASAMDKPLQNYPPPAVRLRLLELMSRALQHPSEPSVSSRLGLEAGDAALAAAEKELGTLALAAAKRILGEELSIAPDRIGAVVEGVLTRARRARSIKVRVHPDDVAALRKLHASLSIEPDPSLTRGGCVVETDLGELDARLEVQIAALARALGCEAP